MSYRLATRYAKSLLDLAQEKGQLEAAHKDMASIESVIRSSSELRVFLKSPIVAADKKIAVLNKIFAGSISDITSKFLTLLVNKGREAFLYEIAQAFTTQYNTLKNITLLN